MNLNSQSSVLCPVGRPQNITIVRPWDYFVPLKGEGVTEVTTESGEVEGYPMNIQFHGNAANSYPPSAQ